MRKELIFLNGFIRGLLVLVIFGQRKGKMKEEFSRRNWYPLDYRSG